MTQTWGYFLDKNTRELNSMVLYLPFWKFYKGILFGIFTEHKGKYYWAGFEVRRKK